MTAAIGVRFSRSMRVLCVTEVGRSVAFYRGRLGFAVEMQTSAYATCFRGGCNFNEPL